MIDVKSEQLPAPRRLYIDNAATSFPKPRTVLEAMNRYATELGASAGRGGYAEAIETAAILADCRRALCKLFNGERPEHFVFTLNATDAINIAIHGLIDPSRPNHVICTHTDHNSVLRPIRALEQRRWTTVTRVPIDPATGLVDPADIAAAIHPDTRFIALTHASNVTGAVQPIRAIGKIARENAVPFIVDAAQSVGHLPIDLQADCIDLMAAPGHKALFGPTGTGFLYVRPGLENRVRPLRQGGTGSLSDADLQPEFMPDKFESGSHNAIGIAGLNAGVQWVLKQGIEKIAADELDLVRVFIDGASNLPGLRYFGPQGVRNRIGVFCVRIGGHDPQELAMILESRFGILTRAGIHCAPLVHRALGTLDDGGATRFSFGAFLSKQDIKFATDALAEIALAAAAPRVIA